MADSLEELQLRICRTYNAGYDPPTPGTKLGLAIQTLGRIPIHGVRYASTETTCGWYIYAGNEWSDDVNFYQPLCVEHLADYCTLATPFLCLPPGWRFMTDGLGFVDVWQDEKLAADGVAFRQA